MIIRTNGLIIYRLIILHTNIKMNSFKFLLLALSLLNVLTSCSEKEQLPPPNIVWITTEDNSVHYMKLYDDNGVDMPNVESLAAEGVTFNNAFSNAAVCSAARSTLISQCYGPRLASHYHRRLEKVNMPEGLEMYPAYFKKAGYYTTNNNKEDYNIVTGENVWDASSGNASWRNRAEGQPFFHIQNFYTTHEGCLHFSQETADTFQTNFSKEGIFIFPNHPKTDLFSFTNAYYRDKHSFVDKQIGEVLAKLKEDGLMENTFIFYYGDHGGVMPGSKGYLYESGLHVPFVVYVPEMYKHLVGYEKGSRANGFVNFIDIPATALNLAGVELPEGIDGKPFLGKGVKTSEVEVRDFVYGYADRFDEKYEMVRSVRKGNLKYIRSYQPFIYDGLYNEYRYKQLAYQEWKQLYKDGKLDEVQAAFFKAKPAEMLFDLSNDPYETKNIANDAEYTEKLAMMRSLLQEQERSMPDLSFYPEYYLIKNAFDNPVAFGQANKTNIERYLNIADLQLLPYADAKTGIEKALTSADQFDRYWALCAASNFAEAASDLAPIAQSIIEKDTVLINKVRAAEFLAISTKASPVEFMQQALYDSRNEAEALLIMNSVALMADINYNYKFNIDKEKVNVDISDPNSEVLRRIRFIESL